MDTTEHTDTDLHSAMTVINTPPEEAAQNIDRSRLFDVSPDSYAGLKEHLDPTADTMERVPAQLGPATKDFTTQSEQHAALSKPDLHQMNWVEKHLTYAKNKLIDIPEANNQIIELSNKEITEGLTDGEKEQKRDLNLSVNEMNKNAESIPDIGSTFKFGTEVAAGVEDFGRAYWENKKLLGGAVAVSAGLGALSASAIPVPGLSTAAGAIAGGTEGLITGGALIGLVDGYSRTRGAVNNELSNAVDAKGQPLNIPLETRAKVSQGVGLISGIAQGVAGKIIAGNNPFLNRFASPKLAAKLLAESPEMLAKMHILGGIAESALAQGGAASLGTLAKIVGENFAKMDESKASFENALTNALNSDTLKQMTSSFTVGAATGGVISGALGVAGYKGLSERFTEAQRAELYKQNRHEAFKKQFADVMSETDFAKEHQQYQDQKLIDGKRGEVLETQNTVLEAANVLKNTKMQKYAPQELNAFTKKVFSTLGMGEDFFFSLESLREFANSPEKAAEIRKVVDPKGNITKMAQELNTTLSISKSDTLGIVTKFPDLADHVRLTPDGESPKEARDYITSLHEADNKRQELLSNLGSNPMTPELAAQLKDLQTLAADPEPYTGKNDYLDSATFIEAPGIMSKDEAEKFNSAHLDARLAVADSLKQDVDNHFETVNNRIFKDVDSKDIQHDIVRLDSEFKVLERFDDRTTNAVTVEHKEKGYSPSAINPYSLPEDLKEIYLENPVLNKRKVFVHGGISLEESAQLNGVASGAELLRILAETPSKNKIREGREQRQIELKNRIEQTTKPAKLRARDKAFSDLTEIHTREMDYMKSKEWPTTKRGIIKIATPTPKIQELNDKAKAAIAKTVIKDLNPNVFKRGESVSQRTALKNFLNGEFEQAFENKGKAALNNEMRREAINASEKIAKYVTFWKKVNSPSIQQTLKDAGYLDIMEEFTDLYKLDGDIKNKAEKGSFAKWLTQQVQEGKWTPSVPDRLYDTLASYKDLTVEEYQMMTEAGQFLVEQAKLKNKLFDLNEQRKELRTAEKIAEQIDGLTKANIFYDPKRAEKKSENYLTSTEWQKEQLKTSLSMISSIDTITSELDEYKPNGYFHENISRPIKKATTAKREEIFEVSEHLKNVAESIYGLDTFKKMGNQFLHIPEFVGLVGVGDNEGHIRKTDLLDMQAYMGDPGGREAMNNFITRDGTTFTPEKIQEILDRELDEKDLQFVQNGLIDPFKRYEQRTFDLNKETTGIEIELVKGVSIVHRGKVYPGGYYPIDRAITPDDIKASQFLEKAKEGANALFSIEEQVFFAKLRSAEQTQQGRSKERTGSQRPVKIDFNRIPNIHEEFIHDLHYRKTGIDILKILKNPINVANMKAVVGPKKFVNLLNSVKDVASKTTERESSLFAEEYSKVNNWIQKAHSLHAVQTIGLNLTSAALQPDSLLTLSLRAGPKVNLYLATHATKIATNLGHFEHYADLAAQINPDIRLEKDGIDNAVVKESYDWFPTNEKFNAKDRTGSAQRRAKFKDLQAKAIDNSFMLVREVDHANKILATLALSDMFLSGDTEGFSREMVEAMPEAERAEKMQSFVQQMIDLSLTFNGPGGKTPLEKNKVTNLATRYWVDRRSRLNSGIAQLNKAYGNFKRKDYTKASSQLLVLQLVLGVSAAYLAMVRGNKNSAVKQFKAVKDDESLKTFAQTQAWNFFIKDPITDPIDDIPALNAVKYQAELDVKGDYRNVSFPLLGVLSNVSMGLIATGDILSIANRKIKKELGMQTHGGATKLSSTQWKTLITDAGYLIGGAPTNSINKAIEALGSKEVSRGMGHIKDEIQRTNREINKFIDNVKDNPDAQEFVKDLKDYQKTLPQYDNDVKNLIPENAMEVLSQGNTWDKVNPKTGAAGTYQFTEDRWNQITALNPNLGLTENGRVSKDQGQQEKAMKWEMQDNTRGLMAYDIPVTTETLKGAHEQGFDNYVKAYTAKQSGRNPSSVPDGWGRSVIDGKEVLTPPTGYKGPNPSTSEDQKTQDAVDANNAEVDQNNTDQSNMTRDQIDPDPLNWRGEYHVDDLAKQYEETKANDSKKEMDKTLKEDDRNQKLIAIGRPPKDKRETEATAFLAAAIRYGREQEEAKIDEQMDSY